MHSVKILIMIFYKLDFCSSTKPNKRVYNMIYDSGNLDDSESNNTVFYGKRFCGENQDNSLRNSYMQSETILSQDTRGSNNFSEKTITLSENQCKVPSMGSETSRKESDCTDLNRPNESYNHDCSSYRPQATMNSKSMEEHSCRNYKDQNQLQFNCSLNTEQNLGDINQHAGNMGNFFPRWSCPNNFGSYPNLTNLQKQEDPLNTIQRGTQDNTYQYYGYPNSQMQSSPFVYQQSHSHVNNHSFPSQNHAQDSQMQSSPFVYQQSHSHVNNHSFPSQNHAQDSQMQSNPFVYQQSHRHVNNHSFPSQSHAQDSQMQSNPFVYQQSYRHLNNHSFPSQSHAQDSPIQRYQNSYNSKTQPSYYGYMQAQSNFGEREFGTNNYCFNRENHFNRLINSNSCYNSHLGNLSNTSQNVNGSGILHQHYNCPSLDLQYKNLYVNNYPAYKSSPYQSSGCSNIEIGVRMPAMSRYSSDNDSPTTHSQYAISNVQSKCDSSRPNDNYTATNLNQNSENPDICPNNSHPSSTSSSSQNYEQTDTRGDFYDKSCEYNKIMEQACTPPPATSTNTQQNVDNHQVAEISIPDPQFLTEQESSFIEKFLSSIPEDTYINPYTYLDSNKKSLKYNYQENNFGDYLCLIEDHSDFCFSYTKKSFEKDCSVERFHSIHIYQKNMITLDQFFNILNETYNKKLDHINGKSKFILLFDEYKAYKIWVIEKFKFQNIECSKHCNNQFIVYKKKFMKGKTQEINPLENFSKIFDAENYTFLKKIFPCFKLIHLIKIKGNNIKLSVYIIKYLQLIICKTEAFRFKFFREKNIQQISLKVLYENTEFNEALAVISILFSRIIYLCDESKEIKMVLEIYNLVYFTRAKLNSLFLKIKTFRLLAYVDQFKYNILKEKLDSSNNITGLEFTKSFKDAPYYHEIERIIDDDSTFISLKARSGAILHDGKNK